jgi:NADH dehydrogenase (ubiquinone) 1 alpha subcomplex subunit 5
MRRTFRLLAAVKPARYLEPGTPTGLTGLRTAAAPRPWLLYLYWRTLHELERLPEESVYRRSTEALTLHRLKIVNSVVPPGYEEWVAKAKKTVAEHPEVFDTPKGGVPYDGGRYLKDETYGGSFIVDQIGGREHDDTVEEWNGEADYGPELEGTRSTAERKGQSVLGMERPGEDEKQIKLDPEPPLTADQYVMSLIPLSRILTTT